MEERSSNTIKKRQKTSVYRKATRAQQKKRKKRTTNANVHDILELYRLLSKFHESFPYFCFKSVSSPNPKIHVSSQPHIW
jgi:hypothetical protein